MRVVNKLERYVSYRLNILGIRVWEDRCHLVARNRDGEWMQLGRAHSLPVRLPQDPAEIDADPLLLTAYQYDLERPGSDLRDVLSQTRAFDDALNDDRPTRGKAKARPADAAPG